MRRDIQLARNLRETFVDRPASREIPIQWQWPERLQEIGSNEAITYASDKWKKVGQFEDYKHVSEAPQRIWVRPHFLVDYQTGKPLPVCGPMVRLPEMPDAFAVLADVTGVQIQLYEGSGRDWYLPNGSDNLFQIDLSKSKLGGGYFPDRKEAFLVIYTTSGVDMIIVGEELDILKDGIVG